MKILTPKIRQISIVLAVILLVFVPNLMPAAILKKSLIALLTTIIVLFTFLDLKDTIYKLQAILVMLFAIAFALILLFI